MIQSVSVSLMDNGSHYTYIGLITARAEQDQVINTQLTDLVAALKTAKNAEDEVIQLSQKSLLTDKIAAADAERDKYYMSYKKAVKAFKDMPIADIAEAAEILLQHIKDYRINVSDKLDRETGYMINFLQDLEEKYSAQVKLLNLDKFVTLMKDANEQVRSLTLQRTNDRMGTQIGALKAARLVSDDAYRDLVDMVNALALVNGDKDYESFIDYVNTEVTHYKREVLSQKASSSSTSADSNASADKGNSGSGSDKSDTSDKSDGSGTDQGSGSSGTDQGSEGGGSGTGGSSSGGSSSGGDGSLV